jgi:hypothetical protein
VQGILHQWKEDQGRIVSVRLATKEEGALSLGAYLLGTPKKLERICYCIRFHCICLLVVSHALDITYIYFHSKLVFPGGFYPGSC